MMLALAVLIVIGLAAWGVVAYHDPAERVTICVVALIVVVLMLGSTALVDHYRTEIEVSQ